jgi:hypothetical protein
LQSVESLEVLNARSAHRQHNNYPFSDGRWIGRDRWMIEMIVAGSSTSLARGEKDDRQLIGW